jgi:hypothetical protein
LLLEPLSVEFNVLVAFDSFYFHFGIFSLLAKLVQVCFLLHASFCFHSEREENEEEEEDFFHSGTVATTCAECDDAKGSGELTVEACETSRLMGHRNSFRGADL